MQLNMLAKRKQTNNYQNHVQYDDRTNTIGNNAKKFNEASNPILATLKAKRGIDQ